MSLIIQGLPNKGLKAVFLYIPGKVIHCNISVHSLPILRMTAVVRCRIHMQLVRRPFYLLLLLLGPKVGLVTAATLWRTLRTRVVLLFEFRTVILEESKMFLHLPLQQFQLHSSLVRCLLIVPLLRFGIGNGRSHRIT